MVEATENYFFKTVNGAILFQFKTKRFAYQSDRIAQSVQ